MHTCFELIPLFCVFETIEYNFPHMLQVKIFPFNPYQENTFVISDDTKNCVIIDPGCYSQTERDTLTSYIEAEGLKVEKLLNTHGHIDHMLGNKFVVDTYKVPFVTHEKVIPELEATKAYGSMMDLFPEPSPMPDVLVDDGDIVQFGNSELEVFFTPGHSAGHISFYYRAGKQLFSGDVLFRGSIGRVDLPGGSFPVLMESIFNKILPLGDDVQVYCGHGPMTNVGQERASNMFILQYAASK